jgi:ATPase subunit of ABC transporter with duplicated ATPase domains
VEVKLLLYQNGQGKSTFIKANREFELISRNQTRTQCAIGYFAQNQAEYLDGEITLSNYGRCRRYQPYEG